MESVSRGWVTTNVTWSTDHLVVHWHWVKNYPIQTMSTSVEVTAKLPNSGVKHTFPVDSQDSIYIVKQYLLSLGVLTQPFSAFSFYLNGKALPNDLPLSSLVSSEGKADEKLSLDLEMVLEPLTYADVKFQLDQVRDALGLTSAESTYVNGGATRLWEIKRGNKKNKKMSEEELLELATLPEEGTTAGLVNSGGNLVIDNVVASEPNPIVPKPAAVDLTFSKWQPLCRSPQLKLRGILAFIYFKANNGSEWHYVATKDGFAHVPQLTNSEFAEPSRNINYVPSLLQIIEQTSPATLSNARKNADRIKQDPLSCVAIPQVNSIAPWLVKDANKLPNVNSLLPSEDTSLREWNEDFQSSREIEADSFSEKIARDRTLCKTATSFADAALQGAMKIVEGSVKALNPDEELETSKVYLDKGIFYTHGSDFATAYAGIEKPEGARKALKKGVQGAEQLMVYDNMELAPVLTAVVDYCGRSLVAQAPVPGIFREIPMIVYGFSEDRSQVHYDEHVDSLLSDFASSLFLKKHPVNKDGLELQMSAEVHGAKSTDGRHYIIDLHRLFVPDLLSKEAELNLLRLEAVKSYYTENPDAPLLNPDVWMSPGDLPTDYASKHFPEDIKAATDVAKYVRESLIPRFVNDIAKNDAVNPIDGVHLTSLLHRNGINMRLLGLIHAKASEAKLTNLSSVALEDAIARSLKYVLRSKLATNAGLDDMALIVEELVNKVAIGKDEKILTAIKTRLESHFGFKLSSDWSKNISRPSLIRLFALKCGLQFTPDLKVVAINPTIKYTFPRSYATSEAMEAARASLENAYNALVDDVQRIEEAKKINKEETAKTDSTSDAENQSKPSDDSQEEPKKELVDAVNESLVILVQALGIYTQVYGSSHSEVAHAFNKVATCFYEYNNDIGKAIDFSRKAITIAERVSGIDNYDVIIMYTNLAFFEQMAGNLGTALALSQRVISLYSELTWPGYGDKYALFGTLGMGLLQSGKQGLQAAAIPWLQRSVDLAKDTPAGPSGNTYFQLAQGQILTQDYKNASRSMEAAYKYYKAVEGPDADRTKEMKAYLSQLLKVTVTSEHSGAKLTEAIKESTKSKKRSNKKKKSKSKSKVESSTN